MQIPSEANWRGIRLWCTDVPYSCVCMGFSETVIVIKSVKWKQSSISANILLNNPMLRKFAYCKLKLRRACHMMLFSARTNHIESFALSVHFKYNSTSK